MTAYFLGLGYLGISHMVFDYVTFLEFVGALFPSVCMCMVLSDSLAGGDGCRYFSVISPA